MKALPRTLFILSGRPMEADLEEAPDAADSIRTELEDPHQPLPVVTVSLGEFPYGTALRYLEASASPRACGTNSRRSRNWPT